MSVEPAEAGRETGTTCWHRAAARAELQAKGRLLVRLEGRQIALFDTPAGVMACNNRCPHEGYPLTEGSLDGGCVLTCNWHNWKFDLTTGANLYGGDRLRTYPVRLRGDDIWVDLGDAPVHVRRADILEHLRDAFDDQAYDRLARELARLMRLEVDPLDGLREAVHWSWQRMEFGWTHAYAATADWLRLYRERTGDAEVQLVCLSESIGHIAFDVLREPEYPFADGVAPWDEEAFVAAVEAEDEAAACARVRGALRDGLGFEALERGLTRAALAHYNDFGHALIYVTKARCLLRDLGDALAEPMLLSLVRAMVYATREDRIPEFRGYARALAAWPGAHGAEVPALSAWHGRGIDAALELALAAAAAPPAELYTSLLGANALNLLAFDLAREDAVHAPVSANVGWLDFTHGITFANAVRSQCTRFPELWPQGLLQMACFSGRNAAFTLKEPELERWRVDDIEAFMAASVERLFDHGFGEYIASAHVLKTTLAVREELAGELPGVTRTHLAAGLNRFLHSPLKRRRARRTAHQALSFVAKE